MNLSREELELLDVEKQMEDQLIGQHRLVERIVASKAGEDGIVKFLTKVRCQPSIAPRISSFACRPTDEGVLTLR